MRIINEVMDKKYNLPNKFTDEVCDVIVGTTKEKLNEKYSTSADYSKFAIFTIVNGVEDSSLVADKFYFIMRVSLLNCILENFKLVSDSNLK